VSDVSDGLSCPETITRTYSVTDETGNSINVAQTITINDVTAPVVDNSSLASETAFCDVTLTAPTATDNCSGALTATADVTFPINTVGTTTVTWTYVDDCGNTSTQTQDVIIEQIEVGTSMAADGITIVADNFSPGSGVTYQWIDCSNNNFAIPGATNHNFTPMFGGDYAVIITENGCSDTSACVNSTVSVDELATDIIQLYPNPSNGIIYIQTESIVKDIQVLDLMGRRVKAVIDLDLNRIDGSQLVTGKYLVRVKTEQNSYVMEVIINN
jgi:hypothetical protein